MPTINVAECSLGTYTEKVILMLIIWATHIPFVFSTDTDTIEVVRPLHILELLAFFHFFTDVLLF